MSGTVRFNVMHFMPYTHLPENHKDYKTTWVSFPNKYYDPEKGHELYQRYFEQLVLADRLGFDAIVVNEHHNTVYSMMATPNVIAAALIPQTKKAKICVWGVPPNFRLPNQISESNASTKTNHLNNDMHVADMPHWKTVKNMTLFAEEVMPRLGPRVATVAKGDLR